MASVIEQVIDDDDVDFDDLVESSWRRWVGVLLPLACIAAVVFGITVLVGDEPAATRLDTGGDPVVTTVPPEAAVVLGVTVTTQGPPPPPPAYVPPPQVADTGPTLPVIRDDSYPPDDPADPPPDTAPPATEAPTPAVTQDTAPDPVTVSSND